MSNQNSETKMVVEQVEIKKQRKFIGWPAVHVINARRKAKKARSALVWKYKFNN